MGKATAYRGESKELNKPSRSARIPTVSCEKSPSGRAGESCAKVCLVMEHCFGRLNTLDFEVAITNDRILEMRIPSITSKFFPDSNCH